VQIECIALYYLNNIMHAGNWNQI